MGVDAKWLLLSWLFVIDDTDGLDGGKEEAMEDPNGGKNEVDCETAPAYVVVFEDGVFAESVSEAFMVFRAVALSSLMDGGDLIVGAKEKLEDCGTKAVECVAPFNFVILLSCFSVF